MRIHLTTLERDASHISCNENLTEASSGDDESGHGRAATSATATDTTILLDQQSAEHPSTTTPTTDVPVMSMTIPLVPVSAELNVDTSIKSGSRIFLPAALRERQLPEDEAVAGMVEDEDQFQEPSAVSLAPFAHQVGGHSALLFVDIHTVCKPLISREVRFYQEAPSELRSFLPLYKGQIQVKVHRDSEGVEQFSWNGSPVLNGYRSKSALDHQRRLRHGSGSSTGEDFIAEDFVDEDESGSDENSTISEDAAHSPRKHTQQVQRPTEHRVAQNVRVSWSAQCQEKQLTKLRRTTADANRQFADFIMLENVCGRFVRPSVLDLKMGTRQHGDDAPKAKMDSQMEKCANTTSKTIGVRACGMQVYQADRDQFKTWDKYYGRSLSVDGFKTALHNFLHNGTYFRRELVPEIVTQLRQLHKVIRGLDGFRFYSSSLLIMYEGKHENLESNNVGLVDVKMIDFAHSSLPSSINTGNVPHRGPDAGYLFGLENLMQLLERLYNGETGVVSSAAVK